MSQNQDLSQILRDIELGPVDEKMAAIGRLRFVPGVSLNSVQPALDKVLRQAPDGSPLKFFAAANLAFLGDSQDTVVEALTPYLFASAFETSEGLLHFPWLGDYSSYFPREIQHIGFLCQSSTQAATVEALSHVRANSRAGEILNRFLEDMTPRPEMVEAWRAFCIYALGANGNPGTRSTLEYYRDKKAGSLEGAAARIALENFGTAPLFQLAQIHRDQMPPSKTKGGCFIATAVYGNEDAPELKLFRRFRDEFLLRRSIGRLFVSVYYSLSPHISALIKKSDRAKKLVQTLALRPALWLIRRSISKR
jgi:hypothetical protein